MNKIESLYTVFKQQKEVCIDTRKIIPGSIFFALKGENFDGNEFAEGAIEKGCSYTVIDNPIYKKNEQFILVDNVLESLQDLARFHRLQLKIPVLAITGSNGKTTTKELIREVVSEKYRTLATIGNLNNHIGVPLTLLSIDETHEFAIIEMGANHQGEIKMLCDICRPNFGLITNIGKAHLEGFGGFEGVIKGKTELYDFLKINDHKAFVNVDNPLLKRLSVGMRIIGYGHGKGSTITGSLIESSSSLKINWRKKGSDEEHLINSNIPGDYNFENILSAICVGNYFEVPGEDIKEAIESYIPSINRSQIIRKATNLIVLDAYNANPSSMESAINNFEKMDGDNKVLILGEMKELGLTSNLEHQKVVNMAVNKGFASAIFIGTGFGKTTLKGGYTLFKDTNEASDWLKQHPFKDSTILVKGSRANALEKLLEVL